MSGETALYAPGCRSSRSRAGPAPRFYVFFVHAVPFLPHFSGFARGVLPPTFLVSILVPTVSDPLCFFFAPARNMRGLVMGSVLSSALVGGVLLLWPAWVLTHFGVFGASALVSTMRLAFVAEPAPLRRVARTAFALALVAYAAVVVFSGLAPAR